MPFKLVIHIVSQVHDVETELAGEQRRHGETQKALRRHERRLAELTEQMDFDFKAKEREQDLMDRLQQKIKQYKRQLDEAVSIHRFNPGIYTETRYSRLFILTGSVNEK